MEFSTRISALHSAMADFRLCKDVLKIAAFFLFVFSILSFDVNFVENKESRCYSIENSSFLSTALEPSYFVLEEIPGEFRMVKAVFSDYEIILRPQSIEYFATNGADDMAHFAFENCNQNVRPDGMKQISSEEVPIKNKAMAEVLQATTMEVTKYEKVVYRNVYDNLDLEISLNTEGRIHVEFKEKIKGAASKFSMKPRFVASDYNTTQKSIALPKSNKDKIDFTEAKRFKIRQAEQASENLSFDIILK